MTDTVIVDGRSKLSFENPERRGRAVEYLSVSIAGPGLSAIRRVYGGINDFSDLSDYFGALADSWRGWDGLRDYASVEGDLQISATHDGHVRAVVRLENLEGDFWWQAETVIRIEAGEQLSAAARELRQTIRG